MAEAHPDRHGSSSRADQLEAADRAAAITDAYQLLRRPASRAAHMLELHNAQLTEETQGEVLGPGFLMQVMDVREEIEDLSASASVGFATKVAQDAWTMQLDRLDARNSEEMDRICEELGSAFSRAAQEQAQLEEARTLTAQLQYLQRIADEIIELRPVR